MDSEIIKLRNFRSRVQRNDFMRNYVLNKFDNKCWYCKEEIEDDKFVLHHLSYDLECEYIGTIKQFHPTPKRPNGIRTVPDCKSCFEKNKDRFCLCTERLVSVHKGCHFLIHKDEIFQKNA